MRPDHLHDLYEGDAITFAVKNRQYVPNFEEVFNADPEENTFPIHGEYSCPLAT
jgi:hypothetical protein